MARGYFNHTLPSTQGQEWWGRDESIGNGNHKKVMISLDDLHCRSISVAHTLITDMLGSTGRTTSRTATIHGHCPHDSSTDGQALII